MEQSLGFKDARLLASCCADVDLWRISARPKLYVCLKDSEKCATSSWQRRKNVIHEAFQLGETCGLSHLFLLSHENRRLIKCALTSFPYQA